MAEVISDDPVTYYPELVQGSREWLEARRGMLTASEMDRIITPTTLKAASNDRERQHIHELLAQRISGYVEPHYVSDDMLRGQIEEIEARKLYARKIAPVRQVGFIVNRRHGFALGYSPDGLVGEDGLIEAKSRRQKYHVQTIVEHVALADSRTVPVDFVLQVQTGLLVSERKWLDFISYCGGLPMAVIRVYPDPKVQAAILDAARAFEKRLQAKRDLYEQAMGSPARLYPTERLLDQDILA